MLSNTRNLIWALVALFTLFVVSCAAPAADMPPQEMIEPGDKIGEMVIRKAVDESETRPFFGELCDWPSLAEVSEEKRKTCAVAYHPTIFIGGGWMESDLDKLNEYWENSTWEVSINGQPLDLEAFGSIDAMGGRFLNVLLENPPADPLQIVTLMTMHEDPIERYGLTLDLTAGP